MLYPLVDFDSTVNTPLVPSFIVNQKESECSLAKLCFILDNCLHDFPDFQVLQKKQEICLVNPACGKDVFAILPSSFGKSLIF